MRINLTMLFRDNSGNGFRTVIKDDQQVAHDFVSGYRWRA